MTRRQIAGGLFGRLAMATRAAYDGDRRQHPERFITAPDGIGPDRLFVENVARMLGCNVDHVRRIPRATLPGSKVGARLIYARADVEAYIAAQRNDGGSRHIAARAPRMTLGDPTSEKLQPGAAAFDPVAAVRKALKASS